MKKYTFRQGRQNDFDFLYEINKNTMKDHVIQTWGKWDEEWQMNYFKEKFKPEDYQIILVDEKEIGTLKVINKENETELELIQIIPEYQGYGIGTAILNELINETEKNQKSFCLTVLKSNDRAKKLYETQGFEITGENKERYFMKFKGGHQNTSLNNGYPT